MKKHLPLILALLLLCLIIVIIFWISFTQNNNHLVYSFDDAYIHMSISKNLAEHGVWGVTRYEFSSSSSSLLWTSLIAFVFYLFSTNEVTPIIFNILPALSILISVYIILRKYNITNKYYLFIVLVLLIVLAPLPALIFTGLEHVLHIFISILFVFIASEVLSGNISKKNLYVSVFLSIFLPVIRYEGIVIVMGFCFLLFLQKKWIKALVILILSLLPIFIFGLISISRGWSFFPNSLMLKANLPDVYAFSDFFSFIYILGGSFIPLSYFILLSIIFIVSCVFFVIYAWKKNPLWLKSRNFNLLILLIINVALYIVYSRSGWSYRYQSFIVSLSIFVFSIILYKYIVSQSFFGPGKYSRLVVSSLIFLVVIIQGFYGIKLISSVPASTKNIYEQQYQMGMFLKEYYNGNAIALNDIGTCNYFADIRCIDLWGLSNLEISKSRRNGNFNNQFIRDITTRYDVRIAIVYDSWFEEDGGTILPKEWIKAGEWKITDNIIAGDDVVSFYAVNSKEESQLIKNLKAFSSKLPGSVLQKGKYLN
ncbi:MAG TPA: hypothetical protein VGK25_00850 [Ignavibacteria bacterium]|jgi:hypothetical protein